MHKDEPLSLEFLANVLNYPIDSVAFADFLSSIGEKPVILDQETFGEYRFIETGIMLGCIPTQKVVFAVSLFLGGDDGFSTIYGNIGRYAGTITNSITFDDNRTVVLEKMGRRPASSTLDFAPTHDRKPDRQEAVQYDAYRWNGHRIVFGFNRLAEDVLFRVDLFKQPEREE